jgi:D-lactate dehydrogenase (cytochrome)
MNKIIELRPNDMDITLQPGISWNDLNDFLKPYGLFLPVDPGPHAHIGGMIATSASGTNAVKYGTMKDWVLNLTVVLPGGHKLKTRSRARKSSTGYDLTRLLCGSEGTLGIITEATLKLAHLPEKEVVGAIAFESNTSAANAVTKVLAAGIEPRCIELLDSTCISAVNQVLVDVPNFPVRPHIFFKLAGQASAVPRQQSILTSILQKNGGTQLRLAKTEQESEELWEIRKNLAYTLVSAFPNTEVVSTDVCVPLSSLPKLIDQYKRDQDRINQEIKDAGEHGQLHSLIMGHVGDGNFHSMM